jgi:peroxiredoxin
LETSQKLSDDLKLTYPVAADTDRKLTKALGIFDAANDISWPAVLVVGPDGTIEWSDIPTSYTLEKRPSAETILKVVADLDRAGTNPNPK